MAPLRTESGDVVAQPDGRLKSTVYAQPQRVRRAGGWVDIDPALHKRTDGTLAPKAATADVAFSGGGSTAPLVRMTLAGKTLSLSWPKPLPKPVVDGATAEYRAVLPDIDLKLTATRTGFTQIFVVHTAQAAKNPDLDTLRLAMKGDGLRIKEAADGSLSAVDTGAGGTVFQAPAPVMWDSTTTGPTETSTSAAPSTAADGTKAAATPTATDSAKAANRSAASTPTSSAPVAAPAAEGVEPKPGARVARVAVDFPAAQDKLVLTPDQGMLDDPATVFPVMIDPSWSTPHAGDWAGVSKYYPTQPYWHYSYNSTPEYDFGVGYCGDTNRCAPKDVKRVFFQIPTAQFVGKQILSATFGAWESHSYSCTAKPVELWSTGYISKNTTWNSQNAAGFWSRKLQTVDAAHGWDNSCANGAWVEFGGSTSDAVRTLAQDAANWGWQTTTFGLKAADETDLYAWKRFTDGAYLQVYYNLPPRQPAIADLTMQPGSSCSATAVQVQKLPQLTAVLKDPDGEAIGAQFAIGWDDGTGWKRKWFNTGATESTTPASGTFKASGSAFNLTLPDGVIPTDRDFTWEVRAWDGASWGQWSSDGTPTACYVRVDASIPFGPGVISAVYPISPSAGTAPPTDGVGRYGTFTIDAVESNVVKYQWGLDAAASALHEVATTSGAPQTINVLVDKPGPHMLSVRSITGSGVSSEAETYYFNVANGRGQRGGWAMDETTGSTTLAGTAAGTGLQLSTGATLQAPGHTGTAMAFDGTTNAYASGAPGHLDTSKSFTVSVWANIADADRVRSAVSQAGQNTAFFDLGERDGVWSFTTFTQDVANGFAWQSAQGTAPVVPNRWTHLTGVYDKPGNRVYLYVDGVLTGQVYAPSSFAASGALELGRVRYMGGYVDPWKGSLDEVRTWDRALTQAEITQVAADQPLTTGLPARSVWHLDEPTGATMVTGTPESDAVTLSNGAAAGAAGRTGQAVHFDGTDDYARTTRPAADGTRSFSVAAWVRLPKIAAGDVTTRMILNQTGAHRSELVLYYAPYTKKWVFGRYTQDGAGASLVTALQPACTGPIGSTPCFGATDGEWTHLVGVSDATAKKIRLYVNGYLVGESDYTQTTPWAQPGPLQLGAVSLEGANAEFFGGDIDDVKVWDRIITAPEIGDLVNSTSQLLGRWKLNTATGNPLGSSNEITGGSAVVLGGGADINPDGSVLPYAGGGTLRLSGTNAYAENTPTLLHTDRSFSLSAWAATAGVPLRDMTVLSVAGTSGASVTLRWHYVGVNSSGQQVGEWQAAVRSSDTAGGYQTTISHATSTTWKPWSHLAVVYDGLAGSLALYVNGESDRSGCESGDLTCIGSSYSLSASRPFDATGGLQLGRTGAPSAWGEYFSGELSDVQIYQGVLTDQQVSNLSLPF
ncbi:LamG domain-containing protein [Kitasatospora sp. NE20-6]|uniref:LamG domain-containing protein n=1 Tax=Kitasatospora sp. NE20-6 TaxID=2859066 RepID=UPI0038B3DFB1